MTAGPVASHNNDPEIAARHRDHRFFSAQSTLLSAVPTTVVLVEPRSCNRWIGCYTTEASIGSLVSDGNFREFGFDDDDD